MSEEKKKLVVANPVKPEEPILPPPPVPSSVRLSVVTPPPDPVEDKGVAPVPVPPPPPDEKIITKEEKERAWPTEAPCGNINIKVYKHRPYEVEFTGVVTGGQIDLAWRAMMKKYRVWKHTLLKSDQKSDGGV